MDTAPGVGGLRVTATVPLLLLNPTPSMAATSTTSTILAFEHFKHSNIQDIVHNRQTQDPVKECICDTF